MRITRPSTRPDHPRDRRDGTASVEFAVCLPVIVALVFGSIEAANAVYLKQTLTIAAYEAAREASSNAGVHLTAYNKAKDVLDAKGVSGYTITITPTVSLATSQGTQIDVTVTAPASANAIGPQFYYQASTLSAGVNMVRQ